jgi:hypothetical protein
MALMAQATGAYKMHHLYTDYKDITKQHFFTQWLKEVKVTAHTQPCINPLNPTYKPSSPDEALIFDMDNAYIFNVAAKTVKYLSGKTIVQRHLDDMDGQKTFIELTVDATGEIVSKINEKRTPYAKWMPAQTSGTAEVNLFLMHLRPSWFN